MLICDNFATVCYEIMNFPLTLFFPRMKVKTYFQYTFHRLERDCEVLLSIAKAGPT